MKLKARNTKKRWFPMTLFVKKRKTSLQPVNFMRKIGFIFALAIKMENSGKFEKIYLPIDRKKQVKKLYYFANIFADKKLRKAGCKYRF